MKKILALLLAVSALLGGCIAGPTPAETIPPSSPATLPTEETAPTNPTEETAPPTGFTPGFVMPDFQVTTAKGEELSLHELLQEKNLVVLNFWFADCPWCLKEFPAIEVSYQRYRSDIEILALNPYDSTSVIASFMEESRLTFPGASCAPELAQRLSVRAYPTSVFIDREGKISLIHTGALSDSRIWDRVFEFYTRDDYRHQVFAHIEDIP